MLRNLSHRNFEKSSCLAVISRGLLPAFIRIPPEWFNGIKENHTSVKNEKEIYRSDV